jgi:hypothetical protein
MSVQVRDMVGNNPIVLIGTKMDLLPVGTSAKEVASWLTEAAARKRLAVRGVCVEGHRYQHQPTSYRIVWVARFLVGCMAAVPYMQLLPGWTAVLACCW